MARGAAIQLVRARPERAPIHACLPEQLQLLERALRKTALVKRVLIPGEFARKGACRPVQRHGASLLIYARFLRRARFLKKAREEARGRANLQAKRTLYAQRIEQSDLRFQRELAGHDDYQFLIQKNRFARRARQRRQHGFRAPHNIFHRHILTPWRHSFRPAP